jgi:hypothetical protein
MLWREPGGNGFVLRSSKEWLELGSLYRPHISVQLFQGLGALQNAGYISSRETAIYIPHDPEGLPPSESADPYITVSNVKSDMAPSSLGSRVAPTTA